LDFGTILALTHASGPSVIQVRSQDILPSNLGGTLVSVVKANEAALDEGALIVIDEARARVRILPLKRN
jgi:predicted nuclease of predicted toxin-antitoxin system